MAKQEFNASIIEREDKSIFHRMLEYGFIIALAFLAVLILTTQVTMTRGVDGESMRPTYNDQAAYLEAPYKGHGVYDTVRITKIGPIRHGDIVCFRTGGSSSNGEAVIFIKRVIGRGGDILKFVESGNGRPELWRKADKAADFTIVDESYIRHDNDDMPMWPTQGGRYIVGGRFTYDSYDEKGEIIIEIPKNHYFLMGDNRTNSTDSRFNSVGFVKASRVEGKVYLHVPYGDNFIAALWRKVFG